MRKTKKIVLFVVFAVINMLAYQNCGSHMQANSDFWLGQSLNSQNSVFKCLPDQDPSPKSARRLTKLEISRTVEGLIENLAEADRTYIKNQILSAMNNLPDDMGQKFDSDDTLLSSAHVAAYLNLAQDLAAAITSNNTRAQGLLGTCATATAMSESCVDQFLTGGGRLILRRPITTDEADEFKTKMKTFTSQQPYWLLVRLFMHPHFIFQIENEGKNLKADLLKISNYELASRLSFYLLRRGPDQALLNRAEEGTLERPNILMAEIERLAKDYPLLLSDSMDRFYAGWLSYSTIAHPIDPMTPEELAVAGSDRLQRQSLVNELQEMTRYYTLQAKGSFEDLFLSHNSFAVDDDLAQIYGVKKWDKDPKNLVTFPNGERSGLFNRAAFLVSGNTHTNPIIRGLMVRREFLCEEITPPPSNIANMVRDPKPDPNASTRERFHNQTNTSACMGCHILINPLGFALENYDAFGRFRTKENIYDEEGQVVNQHSIDPVVQPMLSITDSQTTSTPEEFSQAVAESGKARGCMVQSFFRYAYKKMPDMEKDGCTLAALDNQVSEPDGLRRMFLFAPLSDAFHKRKLD